LVTGDGCRGWLDNAPYDVVIFTGALEKLTDTHKLQVLPGGKLFAILGKSPVMKACLLSLDHNNIWSESMLFETDIPLLADRLKPKEFIF
jgi:protein-L-isoaspartate(D-aspartate) O-methyltransferase